MYPPNAYTMPWIRTDKIYTLIDHVLFFYYLLHIRVHEACLRSVRHVIHDNYLQHFRLFVDECYFYPGGEFQPGQKTSAHLTNQRRGKGKVFDKSREIVLVLIGS